MFRIMTTLNDIARNYTNTANILLISVSYLSFVLLKNQKKEQPQKTKSKTKKTQKVFPYIYINI